MFKSLPLSASSEAQNYLMSGPLYPKLPFWPNSDGLLLFQPPLNVTLSLFPTLVNVCKEIHMQESMNSSQVMQLEHIRPSLLCTFGAAISFVIAQD